ncbi:aromatic acid decarboxylase [Methanothermobacter thermautotrophicus]|jgi:4-hydroxy-3-polyprenylbenzoate decarboxylase|uniref:Flavin prenyltransferase UbiX n=1 Tax=Methanothermobacter thermautotrophicus TaxID=145262 RepID=A0A842YKK5_METTF|nr:UbiX family flavin prenyltransferase [Methanothermobacter thermautotrophicus]MBE2899348.1 aromatic acid decarboxylase [Methanothermobacter thermautotrophicus]MCQ8904266.1 UbiX family flavin prenyltransferase [Methanothermobacter sp.]
MIILAMTGASGVIYGERILKALRGAGVRVGLMITDTAREIIRYELEMEPGALEELADECFDATDFTTSINSGSSPFRAMVIAPCTMKTLSAIANGYAGNALTRAADVCLKERRELVLVPRETPLRSVHLENMLRVSREGGIILPAMPGFYHKPASIEDMADFIAGKVLDVLGIENDLFRRWTGKDISTEG